MESDEFVYRKRPGVLSGTNNVFQGFADFRVLEEEPTLQESFWDHPLPFKNDGAELSEDQLDHESRGGNERRTFLSVIILKEMLDKDTVPWLKQEN